MRIAAIGALALVAVFAFPPASSAGGGCHRAQSDVLDAKGIVVELESACFTPGVIRVDVGQTVTFVNRDSIPHIVLGTGWGSTGDLAGGASARTRFDSPGIFPYSCYYHPGMNGAVVVGDGIPSEGVSISRALAGGSAASSKKDAAADSKSKPVSSRSSADLGVASALVVLAGLAGFGVSRRISRRV